MIEPPRRFRKLHRLKSWSLLEDRGDLVLMQMPEQEYVTAFDYAIPLIRDYRADMHVFPNEPYQKFQPRHAYERNIDWFRFWLQGYEDPNPEKAGQYHIWREMKAAAAKPHSSLEARGGH